MTEKTLEKTYEPKAVEERWSNYWIDSGVNKPEAGSTKPAFSMVIPPPNITGALHLGHALNSTLQDVLARYKRMKGFNVLWLPGIDHAGIATQNVVERQLADEGIHRDKLGRDEFIKRVWEWKAASGGTIINQLKRLGATCDWDRLRFTMDDGLSKAVREVFTRLYGEGLIYRGDYIVNWCPRCATALSDIEVQFDETDGNLYYLEYPLKVPHGEVKSLLVATTRPETMIGDTAVAVNPEDPRYSALIGKMILLPLTGREIPVIGDASVSIEFGTGAVKITPAHDFNDFEVARRHALQILKVMDLSARMNENAGIFAGQDRFEARKKVLVGLSELGLLNKTEKYNIMLGSCYRCSTVVEPALSKQWFVKVAPLADPAIKAVEDGRIRFVPRGWENTYFDWMKNIRDWCISRQIWWGHRIPAWHCAECAHVTVEITDPEKCAKCGSGNITQDSDVLDTWFSSALWPFSTLGWPDEDAVDLKSFYPTSVLSTSFDIIFFWVARMIMMGLKFRDEVPFKDVYIHALIRDAAGQKMSKSKGNVIDPLVMMEKYGTDALRFTLVALAAQGRDIKLSEDRISGYRNFCNKIWNLARFTLMNLGENVTAAPAPFNEKDLNMADKWILDKSYRCAAEVTAAIDGSDSAAHVSDAYRYDEAARVLYRFVWNELCDWYVELIKLDLRGVHGEARKQTSTSVLFAVFSDALKMLHPFMPFITEELYSYLPGTVGTMSGVSYPVDDLSRAYVSEAEVMDEVMDFISKVRSIRVEFNVPLGAKIDCIYFPATDNVEMCEEYVRELAKVSVLTKKELSEERPKGCAYAITAMSTEIYIPLTELIDADVEEKRLNKELDKIIIEHDGVYKKLSNEEFVARAPKEVVIKDRARLLSLVEKIEKLKTGIERIRSMKKQ